MGFMYKKSSANAKKTAAFEFDKKLRDRNKQ